MITFKQSYVLNESESIKYYNDDDYREETNNHLTINKLKLELNLNCYRIENTNILTKAYRLCLCNCDVKDVSMLKSTHILYIARNKHIKNIGMLTFVHELNITGCTNVTDIGNLISLCILYSYNKIDIYGFHLVKNMEKIYGDYHCGSRENRVKKLNKLNKYRKSKKNDKYFVKHKHLLMFYLITK